jgi:hypothetical protein
MDEVKPGCQHHWRRDADEMVCRYCGAMLYLNKGPTGPRWLPPGPGDKPPYTPGDRPERPDGRRKKY